MWEAPEHHHRLYEWPHRFKVAVRASGSCMQTGCCCSSGLQVLCPAVSCKQGRRQGCGMLRCCNAERRPCSLQACSSAHFPDESHQAAAGACRIAAVSRPCIAAQG